MRKLDITHPLDLSYLISIVSLVQNISSLFNTDINYFLNESSFTKILNQKISETVYSKLEKVPVLLEESLLLYKNLVYKKNYHPISMISNINMIKSDSRFFEYHLLGVIGYITELTKIPRFWKDYSSYTNIIEDICCEVFEKENP